MDEGCLCLSAEFEQGARQPIMIDSPKRGNIRMAQWFPGPELDTQQPEIPFVACLLL